MQRSEILLDLKQGTVRNEKLMPVLEDKNMNALDAFLNIQDFLGNGPTKVDPWLLVLNRRLEAVLDPSLSLDVNKPGLSSTDRNKAQTYFGDWQNRATTGNDKKYAHLLANELARMEKESGFTHQQASWWPSLSTTTPKTPYMVSVVSAKTFEFQLMNSQHWKDVGVPPTHGEYTHRIQWYLISAAKVVSAPGKTMSELAKYPPKDGLNQSALWDCLFDRARSDASGDKIVFKAASTTDFRSPEHFNEYLTAPPQVSKFPLLSAFLKARREKRNTAFNLLDYVSAKRYGKPFDSLGQNEQQVVRDLVDPAKEQGILRQKAKM